MCLVQEAPQTVEDILAEEEDQFEALDQEGVVVKSDERTELDRARALIRKGHVNTGRPANEQLLRLAKRCQSSPAVFQAIREFQCPICKEEEDLKEQGRRTSF